MRIVRYVSTPLPDVWNAILLTKNFVVSPLAKAKISEVSQLELAPSATILAKLSSKAPRLLPAWEIDCADVDARRIAVCGAEGFQRQLLWDYEILLGEAGQGCIIDYRVRAPAKKRSSRVKPSELFDRRHIQLRAALTHRNGERLQQAS